MLQFIKCHSKAFGIPLLMLFWVVILVVLFYTPIYIILSPSSREIVDSYYFSIIYDVCTLIVSFLAYKILKTNSKYIPLKKYTVKSEFWFYAFIIISISMLLQLLTAIGVQQAPQDLVDIFINMNTQDLDDALDLTETMLDSDISYAIHMLLFIVFRSISRDIIAPITEEILFRFIIYNNLKPISKLYAMIITSVLFGVAHLNIIQGVFACVSGFVFCCIYEKTQDLKCSILAHLSFNISNVFYIIFLFIVQGFFDLQINADYLEYIFYIMACILSGFFAYLIYNKKYAVRSVENSDL